MLFVTLLHWKSGLSREQMDGALKRRSTWPYPKGMTVRDEYWLSAPAPAVVVVFEAPSYEPIMEVQLTWGDVFDITTVPATTPEEGLRLGPQILVRRQA